MLFLTFNNECLTHTTLAMLALLGLLLSGAEPSSHDFLTGKVNPTFDGDNARAFATHVVHHHGWTKKSDVQLVEALHVTDNDE